jgi:ribose 5-phosphate isomerase B
MGRRLVSELEIRRVAREGKRELDVGGAVVTPSARDLAALLQVNLKGGASGAPKWPAARGAPPERQRKANTSSPSKPSNAPTTASSPSQRPIVALGADHGGVALKTAIAEHLKKAGFPITDVGTSSTDPVDYPLFAVNVARQVAQKKAAFGIMVDGAGIGSCMAANKIAGVRAAMCYDVTTATNAREHNGANVLTLGGGLIGPRLALTIVDTFLATPFGGGRHAARVEMIDALDRRG